MTHLHVDLCCGLGGWQQPFRDDPQWRTVGLDVRSEVGPDVVADVRRLPLSDCKPELLTLSPTCTEYHKYKSPWHYGGACQGQPDTELLEACLAAVDYLQPAYWILENVQGLQSYCMREDVSLEPTGHNVGPYYLWGEYPPFDAETTWKEPGDRVCVKDAETAATIPYHLADALKRSVELYL